MTLIDVINGWSPADTDDEDVNVSPDLFFMTIQSLPSSTSAFFSPICPPLNASQPDPSVSLSSPQPRSQYITPSASLSQPTVSNPPIAPSSDRRAQRNRNRDPSWIPRPRNAFIIFRCEYSRQHSQGSSQDSSNDDDDDLNNATVKTLSKRAAEAWKQLPPSEKERYKDLAEREREEHSKLYPHYRFRPMKRQVVGSRRNSAMITQTTTLEGAKDTYVASAERRSCAPSKRTPSVLASAPEKPRKSPSREWVEKSVSIPMPEPSPTYFTETEAEAQLPLQLDLNDPLYFSTATLTPSGPFPPRSFELCSAPSDAFHDSTLGVNMPKDDPERERALEAYSIGLYNFDLLSPFTFPEYC